MAKELTESTTTLGYRSLFRANDKWLYRPSMALSLFLDRFSENLEWWSRDGDIHVIHIVRTDNVAWLRSKFVARKLDSFSAGTGYSQDLRLSVPVRAAVRRLKMKHWLDGRLSEIRRTNPYHLVCYENLLKDRNATIADAQEFLGLSPELMPEEKVRQRQSKGIPIEQHLSNYDELLSILERENLVSAPLTDAVADSRHRG
jgi:hypothetical protein